MHHCDEVTGDIITSRSFMGPYVSDRVSSERGYELHGVFYEYEIAPCRQCRKCRKLKSLDSATRCELEFRYHEKCSFITLTYNNENLPANGSLYYPHFQEFMKRYRDYLDRNNLGKIKFYMCGEYGAKLSRPHYHAIIFGHAFDDLEQLPQKEHGHTVFYSPQLEKLWSHGYVTVGEATLASARYVASYVHKKMNGPAAESYYKGKRPEFTQGSKKEALGLLWLKEFGATDILPYDELVLNGERRPIPEYFNRKLDQIFPDKMDEIKFHRKKKALARNDKHLLEGNSDVASRHISGVMAELLHTQTFRRSYEET